MILIDSNVPMYLVGAPHPHKIDAQRLLERLVAERQRLVTDAEVFQEILHRYVAIDRHFFLSSLVPVDGPTDGCRVVPLQTGEARGLLLAVQHAPIELQPGEARTLSYAGYFGPKQVGLLESTLLVTLRVDNPNSFRLPIERGIYTFFLEGERVGTGATRLPLDVPARSSSRQQVAIELDHAQLLPRLRSLLDREVDYRIEAEHVVRAFGERSVHSVSEGEVDLRSALRGSSASLR